MRDPVRRRAATRRGRRSSAKDHPNPPPPPREQRDGGRGGERERSGAAPRARRGHGVKLKLVVLLRQKVIYAVSRKIPFQNFIRPLGDAARAVYSTPQSAAGARGRGRAQHAPGTAALASTL